MQEANKVTQEQQNVLNHQLADSTSKWIFDDNTLCAQFLNDFVKGMGDIKVKPNDIEDVTNRFVPLIAEERNTDSVKKINIPNKTPFYFITLIEHKTKVDYNVGMQIFRYIYLIWEQYERDMEVMQEGISKTKGFQYPPVIPIVYYEGTDKWTAPLEFKPRVAMQEMFGEMIPNFTYQLVSLNDYSNEQLLEKGDAISLMMLINKIQDHEALEKFIQIPSDKLGKIVASLPKNLLEKIAQIFRVWLYAMQTPEKEIEEIVSRVEEKKMGILFEGIKINIQEDRRQLAEDKQQLAEERVKMQEEQDAFVIRFIHEYCKQNKSRSEIKEALMNILLISEEQAEEKLMQHYQE